MGDLNLEAIKARAEAATPGPWAVPVANVFRVVCPGAEHHNPPMGLCPPYPWRVIAEPSVYDPSAADAEFIAHARTDVPALVAEVERLRGAANWLLEQVGRDGPDRGAAVAQLRRLVPERGHTAADG